MQVPQPDHVNKLMRPQNAVEMAALQKEEAMRQQ